MAKSYKKVKQDLFLNFNYFNNNIIYKLECMYFYKFKLFTFIILKKQIICNNTVFNIILHRL